MREICSRTVSLDPNNAQEGDSRSTQVPSGCQEFSRTGETIFGYKLHLLALRRRNQNEHLSPFLVRMISKVRQLIETVNGQLTDQFNIEQNLAHSFYGLCARLYIKLAAHTMYIYINRLLGRPNMLQFKPLAFPNL